MKTTRLKKVTGLRTVITFCLAALLALGGVSFFGKAPPSGGDVGEQNIVVTKTLSKTELSVNEPLTADFTFAATPKKYYVESGGIAVISRSQRKNEITVSVLAEEGEGRLDVYADFGNGYQKESVYTYATLDKVFADTETEDES